MSLTFLARLSAFARRALIGVLGVLVCSLSVSAGPLPQPKPKHMPAVSASTGSVARSWRPLSATDEALYRRIFAAQRQGQWTTANQLIRRLDNPILLGHVRFQRLMHPTEYRASYDELRDWMGRYADHPGAYRVYALAHQRQPAGASGLKLPVHGQEHLRHFLGERSGGAISEASANRALATPILKLISQGNLAEAERAIWASPLGAGPSDRLRAKVAFSRLINKDAAGALKLAKWAANRSRSQTSVPDWVAGLAAYQLNRFGEAARHFALHAESRHAGEWSAAAGAYWAGRSLKNLGQVRDAAKWWRIAAQYRFTFYGQLAGAKLGYRNPEMSRSDPATSSDRARIQSLKGGRRALALVQVDEIRRADEELLQYLGDAGPELTGALTRVAGYLGLPQTAVRGAFRLSAGFRKQAPPSALYPQPDWRPSEGLTVDEALIWAFVRQESMFNPRATSSAGARGLMQLMPATANYMAGEKRFDGSTRDYLYEPPMNLALGQRYLRYLMRKGHVGQDLFRLLVAYNAGIGNLQKWDRRGQLSEDPLMFIETLPWLETRLFVERVMANFWIYRQRLDQPTPSLSHLVNDRWPKYVALDGSGVELAGERPRGYR